ncbi:MAG: glycosyltransferase family 4 protein [Acidobacteriia bacterium]|nr:glycosyltransferase family 4 protein [Terriglobia bacterium]
MSEQPAPATLETWKLKVCVLSLYSYPLFNPSCISPFGGSEVRISLIARELAKYPDLEVKLVVFDHGQPGSEVRHGVTLCPWPGRYCPLRADNPWAGALLHSDSVAGPDDLSAAQRHREGIMPAPSPLSLRARLYLKAHAPRGMVNVIRKLRYPVAAVESSARRATAFLQGESLFGCIRSHTIRNADVNIYDQIDADVYMAHGNHDLTANLAYFCRRRGKKYIMVSGSDQDFVAAHEARTGSTDIYGQLGFLMAYTIENADLLMVQSRRQAELAKTHFGRDAVVIPNPVDLAPRFPKSSRAERILWVGKSDDRVKQPELFVDLARRKPEYEYLMIMSLAIDNVHRRILQKSQSLSNLKILTYVPYDEVEKHFAEARLLVNTSAFEGCPDTFLQAFKYGVPIVSLQVDPNGMFSEHGCGLVSGGDFDRLVENVSLLMSDERRYGQAGANCKTYLAGHHDKDVLIPKYREAMLNLLEDNQKARG